MKKYKTQKGITLVALIITIVVLLILAGISISTIKDQEILNYANEATSLYKSEQEKEKSEISKMEETIKGATEKTVDIDGFQGNMESSKTTITYEIGMTWEEWCNSKYNTIEAYASGDAIWNSNTSFRICAKKNGNTIYNIAKLEINSSWDYSWMIKGNY